MDMSAFKPMNLGEIYKNADAGVAQAMQLQTMAMQAGQMRQEYEQQDALRSLARSSTTTGPDGTPQFDLKSFTKGAYGIDPMKGLAFEKSQADARKTALEEAKLQGEVDEKNFKMAADRLKLQNNASTAPFLKYRELVQGGMPDADARAQVQPLYQAGIEGLASSGLFTKEQMAKFKISPQFDPASAEAGMNQVLDAKEQLAEWWNKKNYGLKTDEFAETKRHNQATEGQAAQSLAATLRGQDLTDARARETLAQQGLEIKQTEDGNYLIIDKKNNGAQSVVDAKGNPIQGKTSLTESQGNALGFGMRAVASHNIINQLESTGTMGKLAQAKQGLGNVPLVGGALEAGANKLLSADQQKYEQAQRDFLNAVLRKESGANINESEFANGRKQYFPQPGDSDAVIEQKRKNRETELDALKVQSGPGAKQFPAVAAPKAKADAKATEAKAFATDADAAAAAKAGKIKAGDKITVGGVPGTWHD